GDITDATNCPLAKMIRKRLRKKGITTGVKCVYSEEKPVGVKTPLIEEEDYYKRGRNRIPIGSIATVTGIFGNTIAACLIDEILKN
ncbi:MAG TPA: tRNA threonylcarbamoyladenosine dehydratase, partial [Spirochaetota bacterium]|nr:tRNA threonylcarbamoyladenosine dehydratase [Spirochaetota bacterium]